MTCLERTKPQPVSKLSIKYYNQRYLFNLRAGDLQVESSTEIQEGEYAAVLTAKQILSILPVSEEAVSSKEMDAFYEFIDERVKIPVNLQGHDSQVRGGLLRGYAAYIFEKLLPTDIKHGLESLPESNALTIDLDEKSSPIPWELANDGIKPLHMKFNCARTLKTPETKERPGEPRQQKLVIVANPTGDLPGASSEANYIISQLMGMRQVHIARFGQELTKRTFLDLLKGTQCTMLHYSGHSKESQESQQESYLLLRDGPCYARDIQTALTQNPLLIVFVDSCLSASRLQYGTTSIASSFFEAGVKNYVGALWPVSDNGAAMFASDFYRLVIYGNSIGEALRRARLASFSKWQYTDIVWSSYILYGDPTTRLFTGQN
jgi:CHAT domain